MAKSSSRSRLFIFLDAIHFKVRKEGQVVNKAAYSILGINMDGQKDILGIWISENESASFSEAINTVFPKTEIQLCVIHQLRNNLKYVPHKDRKAVIADLKRIYQTLTIEEAELGLNFER